ncbi:MAG: transglutaminase domain-containing protein [Pirellulales bacterium]
MNRLLSRLCMSALTGSALVGAALAEEPTLKPPVRKVEIKYACEIAEVPEGAKAVDLWIPVATSDKRQTVRLLNEDQLQGGRFTTDKSFGNRIYYRRFEGPFGTSGSDAGTKVATSRGEPIRLELTYDVEVHEATVPQAKKLVSTQQVEPPAQFAPYLTETKMIPIKGRVTELAQGIDLPDGEPLRAARKIYDHLVDTMVYNYLAKGAGSGDAVWACDSKTGDCTDYHSVFIGVCRWRGIPADHVFGMPIPPDKTEGGIKFCHCWARFWVAGVGWIPIDASRADKFPADRDYYFGTIGSTWVTLAHGRDVILEPPQQGEPINMFDEPIAEADGRPCHVKWHGSYKDRHDVAGAK